MSSRTLRHRMLAAGILVAAVGALCAAPLSTPSAQATATGKCIWYDADVPPAPGSPTKPLQDCGLHSDQTPEASYYWSDEALVIVEPRAQAFDYSAYGGLDPFSTEYSLRKANELFPDPPTSASAIAKMNYAQASLTPTARAVEQRRGVSATEYCRVVPTLWSDHDIRDEDSPGFLPPSPQPDGKTGTYTYSLSTTLTGEQRAAVLAGLAGFASAIEGSKQPRLVEWKSGDASPPVITFENAPGGFDDPNVVAVARRVTSELGRDGLTRWVNGNIEMTDTASDLSAWVVMHELLHVYGFDHIGPASSPQVMTTWVNGVEDSVGWNWNTEPVPAIFGGVDACTKAGIDAAPAPQ